MTKAAPAVGALIVSLSVAVGGAEAKLVRYDIDGQSYSYSTNNHEQTAVARERMAAAKAAADARAKAQAEASANPLVRAFGSQAQRDAAAADARLREVLARNAPQAAPASGQVRRAPPPGEAAKAEPKAPARPTRVARSAVQDPVDTGSLERQTPARAAPESARAARSVPAAPKVDAIVYDFASGIKTIHMADGSVDEDVFDRDMAASLKRAQPSGGPRVSFVNEGSAASVESPAAAKD
ncbi:MAG TPA: hypothetical protein VE686_06100 [Beijerinckiaceae bacterium]|nr:hypothetical protein [Beijerinckiaceae bacterium]